MELIDIAKVKNAKDSSIKEQFVELGSASELTLGGGGFQVTESVWRYQNWP